MIQGYRKFEDGTRNPSHSPISCRREHYKIKKPGQK